MFGPQKGADPAQITQARGGPGPAGRLPGRRPGRAGAGAAGGTGYGLAAAWGALITPGAPELGQLAGLDRALAGAGLVITGEGRYDRTSGTGKVVGTVFAAATAAGVPAALVAGQIADGPALAGPAAVALADLAGGPAPALADPARWLRLAGQRLAAQEWGDRAGRVP